MASWCDAINSRGSGSVSVLGKNVSFIDFRISDDSNKKSNEKSASVSRLGEMAIAIAASS